jgi:broad specificity phosphatase PhoE
MAAAQSTVFVVRHAERADTTAGAAPTMNADPELSDVGKARAESLATALKDAGITAIYVTEFKRTQQTAAPLAKALGLTPIVVSSKDVAGLAEQVKAAKGNVLVVGHSNTVPQVVAQLGPAGAAPPTLADTEYDSLFVVTRGAPTSVLRLHYK